MNPKEPPESREASGSEKERAQSTEESPGAPPSAVESRRIVRVVQEAEHQELLFAGPLPPPELLAEYNKVFPGCAEAIVEMAQKEQQHRHSRESRLSEADFTLARRGQLIGATLAIVAVVGAIYLLAHDKSITGLSVLGAVVATFGGAFVYERYQRAKLFSGSEGDGSNH